MLRLLFPSTIDNTYRGQWPGFWLLAPLLFLKLGIAVASLVTPGRANRADGIDISTYSEAALRQDMATTALLGLLHISIGLMGVLAMIRYRAMTPLIYLWLLAEFLGRRVVLDLYPIDRVAGPVAASYINMVLLALMVVGLGLSVWPRRGASA